MKLFLSNTSSFKIGISLFTLFFSIPLVLSAAPGDFIQNWVEPFPGSNYPLGATVNFRISYSVLPDWVGNFDVYLGDPNNPLTASILLGTQTIDNRSGSTNLVGELQIPVSGLPSETHKVFIALYAQNECRFLIPGSPGYCDHGSSVVKSERSLERQLIINNPPYPVLAVSPSPINFSGVEQGTQSPPVNITITNTGGGNSAQGALIMPPGGIFTCTSGCTYDISPGNSHTATVVFNALPTPPLPQTYSGTIQFSCTSGCITTPTVNVPVSGVSTASPLPPNITVSPANLNFGTVYTGAGYTTAWVDRDITIRNTGEAPTTVDIAIAPASGNGIPQYQCLSGCTNIPLPGGGAPVVRTIRFAPLVEATDNAVVTVSGAGSPSRTVSLTGQGNTTPLMGIFVLNIGDSSNDGRDISDAISGTYLNPYFIDWGDVTVGQWPPNDYFSITNFGGGALNVRFRILENTPPGIAPAPLLPFDCVSYADAALSRNKICTQEIFGLTNFRSTDDWTSLYIGLNAHINDNPTPGVKEFLGVFEDTTPGGGPSVYVRIRANVIMEPNINIYCSADYGNVLVQKNSIPGPKIVNIDDESDSNNSPVASCTIYNTGSAPAQVTLPTTFTTGRKRTDGQPVSGAPVDSTRFDCVTGVRSGRTLKCGGPFTVNPTRSAADHVYFTYSYTGLKADYWSGVRNSENNVILRSGTEGSGVFENGFDQGAIWYYANFYIEARAVDLGARVIPQSSPTNDFGLVNAGDKPTKTFRIQMDALGYINPSTGNRVPFSQNGKPMPPEAQLHYSIVDNDLTDRFSCRDFCSSPSGGMKFSGNEIAAYRDAVIEFAPELGDPLNANGTLEVHYNFGSYDPTDRVMTISLSGQVNNLPILQVSGLDAGNSLNFGDVVVDAVPPVQRSITLQNTGAGTITVDPQSIGGGLFSCVENCNPFDLEQNSLAKSIKVQFQPTSQGVAPSQSFGLSILPASIGNRSITLTGSGITPPVLSIEYPTVPIEPLTYFDFDSVNGKTNTSGGGERITFSVCNRGYGSMNAGVILDQNNFTANESFTNLEHDQCGLLPVTFSPIENGEKQATLTVNADSLMGWSTSTDLTVHGTGEFSLGVSIAGTQAVFAPTIVNRSRRQTFTILNTGSSEYGGSGSPVTVTSSPAGAFRCTSPSPCEYLIPAGGSMDIEIEFSPETIGIHTGTIILEGSGITFDIIGNGLPPRFIYKEQ